MCYTQRICTQQAWIQISLICPENVELTVESEQE